MGRELALCLFALAFGVGVGLAVAVRIAVLSMNTARVHAIAVVVHPDKAFDRDCSRAKCDRTEPVLEIVTRWGESDPVPYYLHLENGFAGDLAEALRSRLETAGFKESLRRR